MNAAIIERNRRAVYHALSRVFEDFGLVLRAFDVWEQRFADPRGFRVNLYVDAVAQTMGLDEAQVRALASSMYSAMTTAERNLPHLPKEFRYSRSDTRPPDPPPADVSADTGIVNPRLAVFTNLLAALIEGATHARKFDEVLDALTTQSPELHTPTKLARDTWIKGALTQLRQFAERVPASEQSAVVNDLHVALCSACGAAMAERILVSALDTVERTSEAQFFSPRSLL
jgi:hypothetical protein